MAVTQLYNRTTNLNGLIEYVMNGDKTDEMKYVSGVNCLPETAYEEMIATKNRFNKGKEKIIGYHLIQSFAEEEVTPEVAHELGLEYVNEIFGKDFAKRMKELGYDYSNDYEQGLVIIDNTRDRKVYLQNFFGDNYSHDKVIDRILDYENKSITQYGKKYRISKEEYIKILEIKRKNEIKKLPLLYVLFCLLLKIDPLPAKMDFGKARVPITKEMRIEIKYMNELSRQAVLLTKNKIASLDDLNAFRTKLEDEVRTLKGTRESLQRKKKKSTNQEDIAKFDEELKTLAPKIKQLNN